MASFEQHVRAALDALPPELAAKLENVAVVVEDQKCGRS
jgi:predicted Zn-dependent protease with MMP-like domain